MAKTITVNVPYEVAVIVDETGLGMLITALSRDQWSTRHEQLLIGLRELREAAFGGGNPDSRKAER